LAKRHIRRAFGGTYCGREITAKMQTIHPTEARKDDCVWCRRTYRAEIRHHRDRFQAVVNKAFGTKGDLDG
jgi:hypothetical protein